MRQIVGGMLLAGALSAILGPSRTLAGMSLLALVLILGFLARNRTLLAKLETARNRERTGGDAT